MQKILGLLGYSIKQTAFENIKPFQRFLNFSQKQPFCIPPYNFARGTAKLFKTKKYILQLVKR